MKVMKGKSPGKKSVSDIYEMKGATPETIAYAACMVNRHFVSLYPSS